MNKSYITKERLEELKIELEHLKKEARVEIAERLKRAKEYGDLSENSEYIDAKEAQAKLENTIFEMEEMIRSAAIIKKNPEKDTISIGSTLEAERNGKAYTFTIVGSTESKPEANLVSNESPLGKSFLGKKVGDNVEFMAPSGQMKYKVVKII